MRARILLTNDDGIYSAGLWAAYEALSGFADVTIVAPASQQSAVGRSISIFEPIRVHDVDLQGVRGIAVGGKPTDAVIIGLYALQLGPTLVVSGINIGENLSFESIMTSGTVGAALEAANQGTPAIAFSLQVEDQGEKFDDPRRYGKRFTEAKKIVREIVWRGAQAGLPQGSRRHQREHPVHDPRRLRSDAPLPEALPYRCREAPGPPGEALLLDQRPPRGRCRGGDRCPRGEEGEHLHHAYHPGLHREGRGWRHAKALPGRRGAPTEADGIRKRQSSDRIVHMARPR